MRCLEQRLFLGIVDDQGRSIVTAFLQEPQPGGGSERDAWRVKSLCETVLRSSKQALWQLLRTIHGDLCREMPQRRIGETDQQCPPVGRKIQ
jgi:hypothetical protein